MAVGIAVGVGVVVIVATNPELIPSVIQYVIPRIVPLIPRFIPVFVFNTLDHSTTQAKTAHDPNEITGPTGFGSQGFLPATSTLPYRVDFTNEANATAPADVVTVTQQLDPSLDLSTFQFGDIGFGNTILQVPAGLTSYSTTVNLPSTAPGAGPDGLEVQINASLNQSTGLVTWTFTGLDPTTQDIPINPLEGFLPPDVTAPEGEGFVSYTIQPKSTVTASTAINAQATVVFDTNAPINTAPIANVLDPAAPISSVNPLPATTTSPFTVSWSGQDDPGGSGIASFSVFVSDNGGKFTPLLSNTTQTSTTFTGQVGHTYSFFSVATDNVGNVQPLPTTAQAATTVTLAPPPPPPPHSPPPATPPAPPTLQVPPLLAFFDSLLGGVETVNANGTETITDSIFGIPLIVSTFNHAGNLMSVTLFGINVTFLFEL